MGAHEPQQVRPQSRPVGDAIVAQGKLLPVVGDNHAPHLGKGLKGSGPAAQGNGVIQGHVVGQEELAECPRVLLHPSLVVLQFGHHQARLQLPV
jgi:hypothetical protein